MSSSNHDLEVAMAKLSVKEEKDAITRRNQTESLLLRLPGEIQDVIYANVVGGHVVDTVLTRQCACRPNRPITKKSNTKKSATKKFDTKTSTAKTSSKPLTPGAEKLVCRLISVKPGSDAESYFPDRDQYHCRCLEHSPALDSCIAEDRSKCHSCVNSAEPIRSVFARGLTTGICKSIYYEDIETKKKTWFQFKHNIFRFNCLEAVREFAEVLSKEQFTAICDVCFAKAYPHLPRLNTDEIKIGNSFSNIRRLYLTPEKNLFLNYDPSTLKDNQKTILGGALSSLGVNVDNQAKLEIYVDDVLDGKVDFTEKGAIVLKKHFKALGPRE
jgi:hypothetical protein